MSDHLTMYDVLHKLVDKASWFTEAEQLAAHDAITAADPAGDHPHAVIVTPEPTLPPATVPVAPADITTPSGPNPETTPSYPQPANPPSVVAAEPESVLEPAPVAPAAAGAPMTAPAAAEPDPANGTEAVPDVLAAAVDAAAAAAAGDAGR